MTAVLEVKYVREYFAQDLSCFASVAGVVRDDCREILWSHTFQYLYTV